MQLRGLENPWRATSKSDINSIFYEKWSSYKDNNSLKDFPWGNIYGDKSECTKIIEFLGRNINPYKTWEIRMKRETERYTI
jgi:hypothetical protein